MLRLITTLMVLLGVAGCGSSTDSPGTVGVAPSLPGLVAPPEAPPPRARLVETKLDTYLDSAGMLRAIQAPTVSLLATLGDLEPGDQVQLLDFSLPVQGAQLGLQPGFNFGVDVGLLAADPDDGDPGPTAVLDNVPATINGVAQSGASAVLRPLEASGLLGGPPPSQDGPPLVRFRVGFEVTRYQNQSYQFNMGSGYADARTLVTIATVGAGRTVAVNLCNAYPTSLPSGTQLGHNDVEVTILKPQTWVDHEDRGYLILNDPAILINGNLAFRTATTLLLR